MKRQGLGIYRTIGRQLEDGKLRGLHARWQHSSSRTKSTAKKESMESMSGPSINEPMPRAALLLGLSGTIPFFASAGVAVSTGDPTMAATACHACVAYGCSILSFLGAVHWGIAIRSVASSSTRTSDFLYSVTPSIAAAAAAVLPDDQALTVLLPAFGAALVYDSARFAGDNYVPKWYPKLRRPLTFTAMTATGVCLGVLWEEEKNRSESEKNKEIN